jgi:hypothetical protein
MAFHFLKRNKINVMFNTDDMAPWRHKFFRNIQQYKKENGKIYYLANMWVNEEHNTSKVWVHTTVKTKKKLASVSGLSTKIKKHQKRKMFNYSSHWKQE